MIINRLIAELVKKAAGRGANAKLAKKISEKVTQAFVQGKNIKFKPHESSYIYRIARKINKAEQIPGKPHIGIRREFYPNAHTGEAGTVLFGGNKKVPMIDVDWADSASHYAFQSAGHNFKSKSDFMKWFHLYLKQPKNADKAFRLYDTNAGVRLFDMAKRETPFKYQLSTRTGMDFGQDTAYSLRTMFDYNLNKGMLKNPSRLVDARIGPIKNRFDYRLSKKPGRDEPFIAKFDDVYGYGNIVKKNAQETMKYHDELIQAIEQASSPEEFRYLGGLFDLLY
jgi:hypothetical protein